jgi:hypothetical protein
MGFAQADPPLAETRLPAGPLRRSFSEASRQGLSRIIIGKFAHIRIRFAGIRVHNDFFNGLII